MNILLVDDEAGIRDGLASFLRLKGHRVSAAASGAEARREVALQKFDLLVTDWRLADGSAEAVVRAADCPAIAVSGYPEEVVRGPSVAAVLAKPIPPHRLLEVIETLQAEDPDPQTDDEQHALRRGSEVAAWSALPPDTRDRVTLALALLGDPEDVVVLDDGAVVSVKVTVPALSDQEIARIELIGGDVRVWGPDGALHLELRLNRNGSPDRVQVVSSDSTDWPDDGHELAVDLAAGRPPGPDEFLQLLDRVTRLRRDGRQIHLLNVPSHLHLYAEISGRGHDMPKRGKAGPRVPAVLAQLWS